MLGVYTIAEKSKETAARYKLAKMLVEEGKLEEEVLKQNIKLAELTSPASLYVMLDKLGLKLQSLKGIGEYKNIRRGRD